MPTRLDDLPAFRVMSISSSDTEPKLVGIFTHLTAVREGCSWLYAGNEFSLIGELVGLEPSTKLATFVAPFWSRESPIQTGSLVPWLWGYWQAYHITMIVAPDATWHPIEFAAQDAQHFLLGGAHGWRKVGDGLPEGAVATHVQPAGWDHEHCELCFQIIGNKGDVFGYVDLENHWLCSECFQRYAEPRDLDFAMGT
jgi:hypothetical protein